MAGLTNAMVSGGHYFDKSVQEIQPVAHIDAAPTKDDYNALADKFNALLEQLKSNRVIKVD